MFPALNLQQQLNIIYSRVFIHSKSEKGMYYSVYDWIGGLLGQDKEQ